MTSVLAATPAGAANCNDPESRNSVQCLTTYKKGKGGKKNDTHRVEGTRVRATISDAGGKDQLILSIKLTKGIKFKVDGKSMRIVYPNNSGSVTIKNFYGSGRMETIRFAGGDRIRFSNSQVTVDGPSVKAANAKKKKNAASKLSKKLRPAMTVKSTGGKFQGTLSKKAAKRGYASNSSTIDDFLDTVPPTFGASPSKSRNRNRNDGGRDNESGRGGGGISDSFTDGFVDGATGRGFDRGRDRDYERGYHSGCRNCIDV